MTEVNPDIKKVILSNLNDPQLEGVKHNRGPILILAGAGSGKTRVLTRRVAHLIEAFNVPASRILAVTFTNKATDEMRERLKSILGDKANDLWVATFHSACLRILRYNAPKLSFTHNFAIYDAQDTQTLIKRILKELKIDKKKFSPAMFASAIDQAKNEFRSPEDVAKDAFNYTMKLQAEVYDKYQRALISSDAMDFSDLLVNTLKLFKEHKDVLSFYQKKLEYVLVDEFQDTNSVQYQIVRLLAAPQNNLFVVGDDDQSIYAFRGATVKNILDFERDFPGTKVVALEQNYRSPGNVLKASHAVIEKNINRKQKKLWTERRDEQRLFTFVGVDETEEAGFVAQQIIKHKDQGLDYKDIAIFYRTNAQSRALEEALLDYGIPYRIFGGLKFYERKEVKDILAYLRLVSNPSDNGSFLRIINTPTRGIGAQSVKRIADLASLENISLLEAARELADESRHIGKFIALYDSFYKAAETISLYDLVQLVIEESGYAEMLNSSKDITAQSRLENLQELCAIAAKSEMDEEGPYAALTAFLDRASLTTSEQIPSNQSDESESAEVPVTLMTLHLAKGLEFPVVFIIGFEEGLLPHHRSLYDENGIEEERRLCYVGMTRSMSTLYLTRAEMRGMFSAGGNFAGSSSFRGASRYAFDIPEECLEDLGRPFLFDHPDDPVVEVEPEFVSPLKKPKKPVKERIIQKKNFRIFRADDL